MTALSNPEEATLISGFTAGDDSAWRQAIMTYHGPMLAAARAIVGKKIADEVVQESWMSVTRYRQIRGAQHTQDLAGTDRQQRGEDSSSQGTSDHVTRSHDRW